MHSSLKAPEVKEQEAVRVEDGETPIPALFYSLEKHATETAKHLQDLLKHYDLCVKALKHTEGGGHAITQASTGEAQQASALAGLGVDLGRMEDAPAPPISDDGRTEMLVVIVKDADQVDEVVSETKDRLADMEDQLVQISNYIQTLRDTATQQRDALTLLKRVTENIPSYITACAEFQIAWEEEKAVMLDKLQELEGLREFYSGFSDAYDELLIEVQRRKRVRREMEKVIKAAMDDLVKLYQGLSVVCTPCCFAHILLADLDRREEFRINQAEFIPSDLWPGLVNPPTRFHLVQADGYVDEVPDIRKSVFEKALLRVKERQKPFKRQT